MNLTTHAIDITSLTPPPASAAITQIINGFKHYQVLRAGFRSGLFDWMQTQPEGAERATIAEALHLRGAHLGAFLQALQDLGLVERDGTRYRLAPDAATVLCASSPWCSASALITLEAKDNGWSDLQRFLRTDWEQSAFAVTPPEQAPFLGEVRNLLAALDTRESSCRALAQARSLRCFDGSGGLLSAAIAQRYPHLALSIVVPQEQFASSAIRLRQLKTLDDPRHILHAGNPLQVPDAAPCDYVILFHALYPIRKSIDDALLQLTAQLNTDSEVCLAHWFCLEACETAPGGIRDLDKAVLTDSHPLCGIERFGQRLQQVGLRFSDRQDASGDYGNTKLHFAKKSAA